MEIGLGNPDEELEIIRLSQESKNCVLEEMVKELAARGRISWEAVDTIVILLKQREEVGSTDIGGGVALPHAKCDLVGEPFMVFGMSKKGINWDGPSGNCNIIAMTLAPHNGLETALQKLSSISRRIRDKRFLDYLIKRFEEMDN